MKETFSTILLCMGIALSFGQSHKAPCRDMDFLVRSTVEAISKRDLQSYLSLLNYDSMMTVLQETSVTDTSVRRLHVALKDNKDLLKNIFESAFSEIIERTDRRIKTNNWKLELVEYTTESIENDPITKHHTVVVHVKINGEPYQLRMYASNYHNCFYLFEPMTPSFSKGWS